MPVDDPSDAPFPPHVDPAPAAAQPPKAALDSLEGDAPQEAPSQRGEPEASIATPIPPHSGVGALITAPSDTSDDDALTEPTDTGGEIPPLFAEADEDARPRIAVPPLERPLTVHISQGMPSYSEPDPQIAGVVGRAARASGEPVDEGDMP